MPFDAVTYAAAKGAAKAYTDLVIENLPKGFVYKGAVDYYDLLPTNPKIGDVYTVIYKGTSPSTVPYGAEFVWGKYQEVNQWIELNAAIQAIINVTELPQTDINIDAIYRYNNQYYIYTNNNWARVAMSSDLDSKQDLLVSGTNIKTINNSSILTAGNIDLALGNDVVYSNTNGTTISVGGIPTGTTFNNKPLKEILEDMLYPYVSFIFNSISTTPSSGTFEYGAAKTITSITPSFTNGSKNINLVKIGSTNGADDLYNGSSATSGVSIALTNQKVLDGLSNASIYCALSDGTTTLTKSTSFNFVKYTYYKVTNSTEIPTTNAINNGNSNVVNSITTTDNTYIWFLVPIQKTKIQQYAMNQWNDMTTTYAGSFNFTTDTNQTLTYHAYRTDMMVAATGKYQII